MDLVQRGEGAIILKPAPYGMGYEYLEIRVNELRITEKVGDKNLYLEIETDDGLIEMTIHPKEARDG